MTRTNTIGETLSKHDEHEDCPPVGSRKERPILFSAPMVRALLDGTKTQTRRVVKGLTDKMWIEATAAGGFAVCYDSEPSCGTGVWEVTEHSHPITCPYGQPGDRLWVRETWQAFERGHDVYEYIPKTRPYGAGVIYIADEVDTMGGWRPSIHMPRWASRIDLEVTGVRVERLQGISEADARAEGANFHDGHGIGHSGWRHDHGDVHEDARSAYARLWEQINGAGSWAANPWVWAVEFRIARTTGENP